MCIRLKNSNEACVEFGKRMLYATMCRTETSAETTRCAAMRHATLPDASLLAELGSRTFYEAFTADTPEKDMAEYLADSFISTT